MNKSHFFLASNFRSLLATGKEFTVPWESEGKPFIEPKKFSKILCKAFREAKNNGIKSPIIVGVLPFNAQDKAHLWVPKNYQFYNNKNNLIDDYFKTSSSPNKNINFDIEEITDQSTFIKTVTQIVKELELSKKLNKVVISRSLDLYLKNKIESKHILAELIEQNPNAYNFSVSTPEGDFIGSSPELLFQNNNSKFKSLPLAGTSKRHVNPILDYKNKIKLIDSAKDIYEHKIVTDYIAEIIKPSCNNLSLPKNPMIIGTPTLWHLGTLIQGDFIDSQVNPSEVLASLHPTPALCGNPKKEALEIINKLEHHERGYFGGVIGWFDENFNGEWIVAIRCALIQELQMRLYAGCGIVENSIPEAEWDETQNKLCTILNALYNIKRDK